MRAAGVLLRAVLRLAPREFRDRHGAGLLAAFSAVALVLAAVGVYAVTAQTARRRTRELGIRIALGARARDVITMMLRQSLPVRSLREE